MERWLGWMYVLHIQGVGNTVITLMLHFGGIIFFLTVLQSGHIQVWLFRVKARKVKSGGIRILAQIMWLEGCFCVKVIQTNLVYNCRCIVHLYWMALCMVDWQVCVFCSRILNVFLNFVQHIGAFVHHLGVVSAAIRRGPIGIADVKCYAHAATRGGSTRMVAVVVWTAVGCLGAVKKKQ